MAAGLRADVVVVGGGTAGCVLAGRLSAGNQRSVLLLEAGPDYGPHLGGRWPPDLLDCRMPARSHDWDPGGPPHSSRARVIGGSSVSNACWITVGAPPDYDAWATHTEGRWDYATMRPFLTDAMRELRVRDVPQADRGVWHEAVAAGAAGLGLPLLDDVNAADAAEGVGWVPLNAVGHTRWHAAFAYLDPARGRPNLRVLAEATAIRLLTSRDRATGVEILLDGRIETVEADTVVLAAGVYGNPPLLMRSGIGPESVLRDLGVPTVVSLAGVGENLIDHPKVHVPLSPTAAHALAEGGYVPQTVVKARSRAATDEYWDLHIVPTAGPAEDEHGRFIGPLAVDMYVFVLSPRSRGVVRAVSPDPMASPLIDHRYFTDDGGHDRRTARDGVDLVHDLAATAPVRTLATLAAWSAARRQAIGDTPGGYWHPVGTCAMGPEDEPQAVTDATGRIHGLSNVYVGDASVIPVIPRANTNLTTVAVAARLAESIR
jgi:choline dehydrogenase